MSAVRLRLASPLFALACSGLLSGCYSLGSSGPHAGDITGRAHGTGTTSGDIRVINLTDDLTRRLIASSSEPSLSQVLGDAPSVTNLIGSGDALDISIWEAPPAVLFGTAGQAGLAAADGRVTAQARSIAQATALPEQIVSEDGYIQVPFVGTVIAAGRTTGQIQAEIVAKLRGKAHDPQVLVRRTRNSTRDVTVVGEVQQSARIPLTARGERLLDALAAAGGVKQPINKTMIQITRADKVVSVPLSAVISNPAQNIHLQPDDVVTALFQPYSFTALGAVGRNSEVDFEGTGLTLAQALGRVGGLRDDRADIKGVFIFRLENPADVDPSLINGARFTSDGKIPVIYRANLKDPATFFAAQGFPIRNRDVMYVSTAPLVDLMKFVNIVSSLAFTTTAVSNGLK
ncbi:polysaccharide biosynthesis/export family protein [Sphingobium sp. CFD-1]|uniref:polysaccharide biosynthesis/export family protein n=1 Tax=Sphingobium sp. CFD-1 TaxID=2878545 RepID=UPI00214BCFD3|nr:polysaccharide biosynthesis/export family protein [Sphingobium sp. CFD-1]